MPTVVPHLEKLRSCYDRPPDQGRAGSSPEAFVREMDNILGTSHAIQLASLPGGGSRALSRKEVRDVCRDGSIDVLVAYCVVMRWGGRNPHNFRLSISKGSAGNLRLLLDGLRKSTSSRAKDFDRAKKAASMIKGLGISFYTKLLFFFRKDLDAYILDQWTAKSAILLFDPAPVRIASTHFPAPDTTAGEYDAFCQKLEDLRGDLGSAWTTGEQVERTIFSERGHDWRIHVASQFPASARKTKRTKKAATSQPAATTPTSQLALLVAEAHEKMANTGLTLPAESASVINLSAVQPRVNCGRYRSMNWQYNVNAGSVNALVAFEKPFLHLYDDFRRQSGLAADEHDFGDGLIGNGDKPPRKNKTVKATRTITIALGRGASSPEIEWPGIASEAVEAMNRLHERITALLP